jgi:KaiC/GvpD/RAD55 family RecA-like ATPase
MMSASGDNTLFGLADISAIQSFARTGAPVFPCDSAKRPLTPNGFHDASRDPERIRAWWTRWPGALVGVPMGSVSGLVCIDYDSYKNDPASRDWFEANADALQIARIHGTQRVGRHYVYRTPEGARIRNQAGAVLDGKKRAAIDVRGDGGYIIWWPLHGLPVTNDRAPELPQALLEQILDRSLDKPKPDAIEEDEVLRVFSDSNMYLRELAPGKHAVICPWSHEHTSESSTSTTVVFQPHFNGYAMHAFKCMHAHCSERGMRQVRELLHIGESAPVSKIESEFCKVETPADENASPRLIQLGFSVHEAQQHLDLPYLVKDVFDRGQIIVLWGAPGSGKTFLATHLSAHIGAGVPWVGRRVKRGQVLYICAESTRKRLENRVTVLKQKYPELAQSEVIFVPVFLDLLHGEEDIADVLAACKSLPDIALVVIDTLAVTMAGGDENAPEDMGRYVGNVKRIKAETGAAVMIVHHGGKDASRGMRGHSSLIGALDAELVVERIEAAPGQPSRIVKAGKLREGISGADLFAFELEPHSIGVDPDGDIVSTCVVVPVIQNGPMVRRPSVGTQAKLLSALESDHGSGTVAWTMNELRTLAHPLMSRNMVSKTILALQELGYLKASVGGFILANPPAKA